MTEAPIRVVLALAIFLAGCGDGGPATPSAEAGELRTPVHIRGAASQAYPDGSTVECTFDLHLALTEAGVDADGARVYAGTMGGESYRKALNPDSSGVAFYADMAWPTALARVVGADSVELRPSGRDTISRYWDGFHLFAARIDSTGYASGPWVCAPFDIKEGGYTDTLLTALGSWELVSDEE